MPEHQEFLDSIEDQAGKYDEEADFLQQQIDRLLDGDRPGLDQVKLALFQAKRVRREGGALVKLLAQYRDTLQP